MDNPLTALTDSDRCDRCGARAYARTMHGNSPLLWCVHHFREHRDDLTPLLVYMTPEIAKIKDAIHT